MKYGKQLFIFFLSGLIAIAIISCEAEEDDDNSSANGTLQLKVKAVNSEVGGRTSSGRILQNGRVQVDQANGVYQSFTNFSGAPDAFNVTVTYMALVEAGEVGQRRPIFSDDEGKTLAITGSRVDLSDMFTNFACVDNTGNPLDVVEWYNTTFQQIKDTDVYADGTRVEYRLWETEEDASCECGFDANGYPMGPNAEGKCPPSEGGDGSGGQVAEVEATPDSYRSLIIRYKRIAQIKGCLSGYFSDTDSRDPGTDLTQYTYCTQASKAYINGVSNGASNSDFVTGSAELMDFDLWSPGRWNSNQTGMHYDPTVDTSTIQELEFPISGGVTIATDGDAQLTLVIDTNRLLRFFKSGQSLDGRGPGPDAPSSNPYFYSTTFDATQFVFVGSPGGIYGYELVTNPCVVDDVSQIPSTGVASDYTCSSPQDPLPGWLTLITDANGDPIVASISNDDDLNFSIVQGDTKNAIFGAEWDSPTSWSFEYGKNWTRNADNTFTFDYGACNASQDGSQSCGIKGVLYNISTLLPVGSLNPSTYFTSTGMNKGYGPVTVYRRL